MPRELTAPVAGTVSFIAAVGERVGLVAVVEAMKMEHEVVADPGGEVTHVDVAVGDTVSAGQPLAQLKGPGPLSSPRDAAPAHAALDEVVARHAAGLDEARPHAVAKRREQGRRTARENVADLVDEGTFVEYGPLIFAAQEQRRPKEELIERTPADGLVGGIGDVDGSPAVVMSYDYTVLAGTQGMRNHLKKDRLFELAERRRLPVVLLAEGGGGRPGDVDWPIVAGLDCRAFHLFGRLSGLVPLVGIAAGYCFAGNAALLGCCDVVIATEDSSIGMGGPAMIEGGGLGVHDPADVGPIDVQDANGVVDLRVPDEAEAVAVAKRYLSFFDAAPREFEAPASLRGTHPGAAAAALRHSRGDRGADRRVAGAAARLRPRHRDRAGAGRGPAARDRRQRPDAPRRRDRHARRRQGRAVPAAVRRVRSPGPVPVRHARVHGRPGR